MKCCKCLKEMEKCQFTTNQLKKKSLDRSCKMCVDIRIKSSEEIIQDFLTWIKINKVNVTSTCIESITSEFRCVKSTRFIKKDAKVIKIPKCLLMTTIVAKELDICKKLPNMHNHTWLALMLLTERDKGIDSFWYPYIQMLPRKLETVPLFYTQEKLKKLGTSFVRDMVDHTFKQIEKDFNVIKQENSWSLFDYMWARVIVITRIFGIKINGETTEALVPLADMCNHTSTPNTSWSFDAHDDSFVMLCTRPISNNIEITDSYGPKCNSRYFVNYGFTLPNNELNNQAVLFFSNKDNTLGCNFDDGFSHYNIAIEHKWETKVSQNRMFRFQFNLVKGTKPHQVSLTMINFLRSCNATKDELKSWKLENVETVLSIENETLTIDQLYNTIQHRLQELPIDCDSNTDIDQILNGEKCVLINFQNTLTTYKQRIKYSQHLNNAFKKTFIN